MLAVKLYCTSVTLVYETKGYTTQLSLSFHAKVATVVQLPGGANLVRSSYNIHYVMTYTVNDSWKQAMLTHRMMKVPVPLHQSEVLCTFGSLHNSSNHSNLVRIFVCNFLSA